MSRGKIGCVVGVGRGWGGGRDTTRGGEKRVELTKKIESKIGLTSKAKNKTNKKSTK